MKENIKSATAAEPTTSTEPTAEEILNAMTIQERIMISDLKDRLAILDCVRYPACSEEVLAVMKADTAKDRRKFERQIEKIEARVKQRLLFT